MVIAMKDVQPTDKGIVSRLFLYQNILSWRLYYHIPFASASLGVAAKE